MTARRKPTTRAGFYQVFSKQGWCLRLLEAVSPEDAVARYNRTKRPGYPAGATATYQEGSS